MTRRRAGACAAAVLSLSLLGCQGDLPTNRGDFQQGFSAILVRGRVFIPTGETRSGVLTINFESDSERYIVPFPASKTEMWVIEPGMYRWHPTRGPFGVVEGTLPVRFENRLYRVPFPRDILRRDPINVRPGKVISLGILEARLIQVPGERRARVEMRLDDSVEARRTLIEEKINDMLNPNVPLEQRENAVAWTRALDQALVDIQRDPGLHPAFKPGPAPQK